VDLYNNKRQVEYSEVYFGNKFVKDISGKLQVPLEIDYFIDLSC